MKRKVILTTLMTILTGSILLTGCSLKKKSTEVNTSTEEPTTIEQNEIDSSMGFDSSEDALNAFSKIFSTNISKEDIDKCIYINIDDRDAMINNIISTINDMKSTITFDINTIKYSTIDMDSNSLSNFGYENADAVKANQVMIIGELNTNNTITKSLYSFDLYTVCMNNKWFITKFNLIDDSTIISQKSTLDLSIAEGTLENPATLNQWIKTTIINPDNNNEVKVLVKISKVLKGSKADKTINKYIKNGNYDVKFDDLDNSLEYCAFKYEVYCEDPSIFSSAPIINFSICNSNDDGSHIKNFKDLDTTWDISTTDITEFKSTCIWNTGFKVFTMIKDNNDYLFKITSASNTNSYIKPINNSETPTETTN